MFSFLARSLNDLTSFIIYLQDDQNKEIEFNSEEKKINILNFQIDVYLRLIEEKKTNKTTQQIKEEQLNLLLEDVKKNPWRIQKSFRIKRKTTLRLQKNT